MNVEIIGLVVFYLFLAVGFLSLPFGLPGTVIIWVAALVYGWATGFARLSGGLLLVLLGMSVIAEVADNVLSAMSAKKYGTSNRGVLASIIGGIAGAVLGSNLSAILGLLGIAAGPFGAVIGIVVGPLMGAFMGAFVAVVLVERAQGKDRESAFRAGWGSMVGRLGGLVLKEALAIVMVVLIVRSLRG